MTTAYQADFNTRMEHLDRYLKTVANRDTFILRMFLDKSSGVGSNKVEWVNKALVSLQSTLKTALASTTGTIITVSSGTATGEGAYIPGRSVLDICDELMLVTSIGTVNTSETVLYVTRGYSSSTTAATTDTVAGKRVQIVSNSTAEGFTYGRDDSQTGVKDFNYTQIFTREIRISDTARAIAANGYSVGNEMSVEAQVKDKTLELFKELQSAMIWSNLRVQGTSATPGRMAGLKYWATQGGGNNSDQGGKKISFGMLDELIQEFSLRGGEPGNLILLTSFKQQWKINELKETRIVGNQSQSEMSMNNFVNRYDFGTKAQIDIYSDVDFADDEFYLLDKSRYKVKALKGREFKKTDLPKLSSSEHKVIEGEYTTEYHNPRETLFRYKNLGV